MLYAEVSPPYIRRSYILLAQLVREYDKKSESLRFWANQRGIDNTVLTRTVTISAEALWCSSAMLFPIGIYPSGLSDIVTARPCSDNFAKALITHTHTHKRAVRLICPKPDT